MEFEIERVLRKKNLSHIDGLSNSQRDREIHAGRYPAPFKLSSDPKSRAVGWRYGDVKAWIEQRANSAQVKA